jgi:hypothetical protein
MTDCATINPESALKVAAALRARLMAGGMEDVQIDFVAPDRFAIDMVEGDQSSFDQFHDIGLAVFDAVRATGNRVVADYIPTFQIHPALHLEFRLVLPIVPPGLREPANGPLDALIGPTGGERGELGRVD